jgi:tetratricopeptide (TPR) repeat protein
LKLNRNNSIAWYKFGIALHELGQLDKSKEAFENALDIKEIKNNGKMDEAEHVEHVSEKESIKTDDVLTHYRIGKVHIKHKMYIEALKEFLIELPAAYFIGGLKKWIHTWN